MIARDLPWSWRAWLAAVAAAGIATVLALLVLTVAVLGGADQDVSSTITEPGIPTLFGGMFLVGGIAGAFWLLVPYFAAKGTPHPAGFFLFLAPAIPLVRATWTKASAAAEAAHLPLLENLPSLLAAIPAQEWA